MKAYRKYGKMLNITRRDEHVPEIERFIRTVKERVWAIVNTLPFKRYPNRLIIETVYNAIFWLNCFPHKNWIHPTLSPHTIITGSTITTTNTAHYNLAHTCKYTNHTTTLLCPEPLGQLP